MGEVVKAAKILIVDDDETFRLVLARELGRRGFELATADGAAAALRRVADQPFNLALVDLRLPDGSGLDVVRQIKEARPDTEVLVLTGHGTIDTAIEAIRLGAHDYLQKPCPIEALEVSIHKALERQSLLHKNAILRDGLAPPDLGEEFVGASAAFRELRDLIDRVAATDSSVLIVGETGAGKEVVAKLIHARSARRRQPLVIVDCAALHEDLLNSELFGHVKGAFTGAWQSKHGLFEVADGGTVFLDEIGDMSLTTQVKLLRVLETGRFRSVGGTDEIGVDIRVLAATNRDLADMMERGFFRKDLFFRLNAIRLEVLPLRRRHEDIDVLASHFLQRVNARYGQNKRLGKSALDALKTHPWPGNVRELLHVIERAVILCRSDTISADHLPAEVRHREGRPPGDTGLLPLDEVERHHILHVLAAVDGNRSRAAEILGIGERTLYRKLRAYEAAER
jgi:DNA-binding NtrC family response regulator